MRGTPCKQYVQARWTLHQGEKHCRLDHAFLYRHVVGMEGMGKNGLDLPVDLAGECLANEIQRKTGIHQGRQSHAWHHRLRLWMKTGNENTPRSEEHTSELQSLMGITTAVFCLQKK